MSARGQTPVVLEDEEIVYRGLEELPERRSAVPLLHKVVALLVVAAFVAGAAWYVTKVPGGKDHVDQAAKQAREQLDAELEKIQPYLSAVVLGAGLGLLLAGRRLYTLALFAAGSLMGGFIAYTLWTTGTASLTGISAQTKLYVTVTVTVLAGAALGRALAALERVGTAAVAGCAGWAAGALLYPLTLDHLTHVWWGQYFVSGLCAALAALVVFGWEDQLLAVSTSGFGAYAAATGGAKLFFHYSPTSKDWQAHWGKWNQDVHQIETGTDKDFYLFLAAVLGLFVIGLLVQLKLDPYCCGKKKQDNGLLSFYDDEEGQQRVDVNVVTAERSPAQSAVRFY